MHLYILLTRASSGSALGSTPNSKSLAPRPIMEPPSPARMGEESSASARLGPGGTVTRWEPVPSFPFKVFMKAVSFSVFTSWIKRSEDQWPFKTRVRYGNTTLCFVWHSITTEDKLRFLHLFSEVDDIHIHFLFFQALRHLDKLQSQQKEIKTNYRHTSTAGDCVASMMVRLQK